MSKVNIAIKTLSMAVLSFSVIATQSCADTLLTAEGFAGKPPEGAVPVKPNFQKTTVSLGVFEVEARAVSTTKWIYFDLESGTEVTLSDAFSDNTWDIAFQRFRIKINGGNSGNGNNAIVPMNGQSFDTLTAAPTGFTGNITDRSDAGTSDDACRPTGGTLYAYLDSTYTGNACWFSYADTTLTARNLTYVHRTHGNKYYKVRFTNYYSDTGTSGYVTFKYSEVSAP